jgi:hypothetical protein
MVALGKISPSTANDIYDKIQKSTGDLVSSVSLGNLNPVIVSNTVAKEPTCVEQVNINPIVADDFITSDTVVRYKIDKVSSTELKDGDQVVVNKETAISPFVYQHQGNVKTELASMITKYVKFPISTTAKQDAFATLMMGCLTPYLEPTFGKSLGTSDPFFVYFKDDAYHRIVEQLLKMVLREISKSSLFNLSEFQKIEFVQVDTNTGNCPSNSKFSLLDVDDIKNIVQDRYQKTVNECSKNDTTIAPIEKANLEGVVVAMVRIYVIELLLRAMFVFSRYKLSDITKDQLIIDYISWEIEQDIKKKGPEFYDVFLTQSKKIVQNRGDRLQTGDSSDISNKIANDELNSENQSGLAFLKYLVGQQIEFLAPKFEELLLINASNIIQGLIDKIPVENLPDPATKFSGFDNGSFVFQQYVHVYLQDGKDRDFLEEWDMFSNNTTLEFGGEKCGRIGLRLVYIPALSGDYKFQDIWESNKIKVIPNTSENFCAYSMDGDKVHPIIIVSVEENDSVSNLSANKVDFDGRVSMLYSKLTVSEQFRMLFEYMFNLKEYLSFATIYNINTIIKNISNIENSFDASKRYLRILFRTLANSDNQDWWRKEDDEIEKLGGNDGIFKDRMDNIKASGPAAFLSGIALRAVTIIIKGFAERFDPAYKLLKQMDDAGATIAGLTWASLIPQIQPINIIPPPFGFGGPPIGPYGIIALSTELLSGEIKDKKDREKEKELNDVSGNGGHCEEGGGANINTSNLTAAPVYVATTVKTPGGNNRQVLENISAVSTNTVIIPGGKK